MRCAAVASSTAPPPCAAGAARATPCSCAGRRRSQRQPLCPVLDRAVCFQSIRAWRLPGRASRTDHPGMNEERTMPTAESWVVVGLDNGGTTNNATVLDASGRFRVDRLVETESCVREGPEVAVAALVQALDKILALTGTARAAVRAVGLDTPGPASAEGVISSKGATNFSTPAWRGYDFRAGLETRLGLPVVYNNDGNAAALYAHYARFGPDAAQHSSISAIVGTGLGGGVIEAGRPLPECNGGLAGDVESVASLMGIEKNLLPYWLSRFEGHELAGVGSLD